MKKCNTDIRLAMMKNGITQVDLAKKLGVDKTTLCTWLRFEMPREKKDEILKAIKEM